MAHELPSLASGLRLLRRETEKELQLTLAKLDACKERKNQIAKTLEVVEDLPKKLTHKVLGA